MSMQDLFRSDSDDFISKCYMVTIVNDWTNTTYTEIVYSDKDHEDVEEHFRAFVKENPDKFGSIHDEQIGVMPLDMHLFPNMRVI